MDDNASIKSEGLQNDRHLSVVRKSFRVPVEDNSIRTVINGQAFSVINICPEGIRMTGDVHTEFIVGQTFDHCRLIFPAGSIDKLTARVVHISMDDEKQQLFGIQWVDLKNEELVRISAVVSDLKKKLLAEQHYTEEQPS